MVFLQVFRLQQGVLPLALNPGPDRLDGVEVGGARGQELNNGACVIEEVPDYVSSMSPVVVHHNHFVLEIEPYMELLVEILDGLFVGRVGDVVEEDFHLLADGSDSRVPAARVVLWSRCSSSSGLSR